MEILKNFKTKTKFRVLEASFMLEGGRVPAVGELIIIEDRINALELVSSGKVSPADLQETGIYLTLREISLPGEKERFVARKNEKVLLRADDALSLMLQQAVIPINEDQWQPYEIHLAESRRGEIPPTASGKDNWVRGYVNEYKW
jgi:hypothetical protein